MLAHQNLSAARVRWTSSRGELVVERPSPPVLVFVEKGFLDAEFAAHILSAMNAALDAPGMLHFFVDAEFLDGYDPLIRSQAGLWIAKNRDRIVVQHTLVRSPLAKLGFSVASFLLGGAIVGHVERSSFDEALRDAIQETHQSYS